MIANECKWFWTYVNDCECIMNECKLFGMNVNDSKWM